MAFFSLSRTLLVMTNGVGCSDRTEVDMAEDPLDCWHSKKHILDAAGKQPAKKLAVMHNELHVAVSCGRSQQAILQTLKELDVTSSEDTLRRYVKKHFTHYYAFYYSRNPDRTSGIPPTHNKFEDTFKEDGQNEEVKPALNNDEGVKKTSTLDQMESFYSRQRLSNDKGDSK